MANKFNRTNFLQKPNIEGRKVVDLTSNTLGDFIFSRPMTRYVIVEEDLMRPDVIAIKAYNNVDAMKYWWIILYVNQIQDVWNDIIVGSVLLLPDVADLEDFVIFNQNQ